MGAVIVKDLPELKELKDGRKVFGRIEEITSIELGAIKANVVRVTLFGPDFIHWHIKAEETYICESGKGELFLDGRIVEMSPGTRIIISPGTLHAARPWNDFPQMVFLCVSSPPFNSEDVFNDPRGRNW
jgi:quercetin dioxygenase-like cupin family protein